MTDQNPLAFKQLSLPLRWLIHRVAKLGVLKGWYDEWLASQKTGYREFLDFTLGKINADFSVTNPEQLEHIPKKGPLIIVANHPLGGLDGMLLSRLLLSVRPDLKVLTNEMLLGFKEFEELFIGVDVLNTGQQQKNASGIRRISKHLNQGGALLVFPAGTVSVISHLTGQIHDAPWQAMIAKIAQKYQAQCVPLWVEGRNSRLFYLSGLVHARLRTLLLPRAMQSPAGPIAVTIGKPAVLSQELSAEAAIDQLRFQCELLQSSKLAPATSEVPAAIDINCSEYLAKSAILMCQREHLSVYCLAGDKLGPVAAHLYTARAVAFHAVGEGTVGESDTDQFDGHYDHLILWDHKHSMIAGAYRAADIAKVFREQGLAGLYSYSLFHYDERFLQSLGGAIEVGRSFVAGRYQNNPAALDLLWMGLGAYMVRHPHCHTFFGCVSMSNRLAPMVRALLVDTLIDRYGAPTETRNMVKAQVPFNYRQRFWSADFIASLSNMAAVNKLLGSAGNPLRVPALIRHYLSLNGKFIEFTVNKNFSDSLDGLIYVDLRQAPARFIKRYLGTEGAAAFALRWQEQQDAA